MAKKKNNKTPVKAAGPDKRPPSSVPHGQRSPAQNKTIFTRRYQNLLIPAAIAIVTWLFLNVCLDNKLTNWDDPGYIRDNALIKDLSAEGIRAIFSTQNAVMGNYHPLTIFSYAIEYSYVRLNPWLYHLDSLLLHILVTLLVYWFVNLLSRRSIAAAITALLFGLHPMHIESVAWLAGRKDVVYGTFYIAACIAYVYYLRAAGATRWRWYAGVILLFVCSLLSKPVAVTLPLALLLIDYFEKRKLHYSLLIEKIPHFAIAIAFGVQSILDQQKFGALDTQNIAYTYLERLPLGCYALITYLWKAVAPVGLSCFYPYPEKPTGTLPFEYYIYPPVVIAVIFMVWKFLRKNMVVIFGLLFFLVHIALLLQFIPVGGAILADRYTYIPYLGLFFIAGWYVSGYFEPGAKKHLAYPALAIVLAYALVLGYLSNERCKVWYDTTTLWRDVIEKQPRTPNAYNNLGFNYFNKFNESVNQNQKKIYYDSSYYFLNKAIELQPTFVNPYISLGELMRSTGQFTEAKKLYYKALSLKGNDKTGEAYLGLAITYAINHNFDSSGFCFREAIRLKPNFPEAHSNYGNYLDMTGKRDSAIIQYGIAISQNPDMDAFYLNRGRALIQLNRWDEAMKDFERAIAINPNLGDNYYARSHCYAHAGNKALALQDVQKAISLGCTQVDKSYYESLRH
ncbi:MAG: tetratricopeptide repeat protein [Chitinophagales bacterium]